MEHVQARWFYRGRRRGPRLIVVHCTVSREVGTGAEAVARYFATTDRKASAHRVVDNNSTVSCVHDKDTAFGAAGANADGLHLELVGMPDQTTEQWLDGYSRSMLSRAGTTVREWSARWAIPLRWLSVAQVADGRTRGLCTHHDVSRAFPDVSTGHWDPGPNFPKNTALHLWREEDDDMTPEQADQLADVAERLAELEGSVPKNLLEQLAEIRVNLRTAMAHAGIPADQIRR